MTRFPSSAGASVEAGWRGLEQPNARLSSDSLHTCKSPRWSAAGAVGDIGMHQRLAIKHQRRGVAGGGGACFMGVCVNVMDSSYHSLWRNAMRQTEGIAPCRRARWHGAGYRSSRLHRSRPGMKDEDEWRAAWGRIATPGIILMTTLQSRTSSPAATASTSRAACGTSFSPDWRRCSRSPWPGTGRSLNGTVTTPLPTSARDGYPARRRCAEQPARACWSGRCWCRRGTPRSACSRRVRLPWSPPLPACRPTTGRCTTPRWPSIGCRSSSPRRCCAPAERSNGCGLTRPCWLRP